MSTTRSQLMTAVGIWMTLAASAAAQYTLPKAEQNHRNMSLSSRDHAAMHSRLMWKLQARLDTVLQRSHQLEQRITEREQNPAGGVRGPAAAFQMTQDLSLITEALHSLAGELDSLMSDEAAVRDRALQAQMEEIQLSLGDIASETQKILTALEKMTRMAPPTRK